MLALWSCGRRVSVVQVQRQIHRALRAAFTVAKTVVRTIAEQPALAVPRGHTSIAKPKPKRTQRRPDPLASVTIELRGWFEAELWHTARELLERLQVQYPGAYPDGQLRTLQRRLKEWR